jgi:multiple sugar transport system permease protein
VAIGSEGRTRAPRREGFFRRQSRREALEGYLWISLWLVGFLGLRLGPMLVSAFLSLCKYDILTPARFVGLKNYIYYFSDEPLFFKSLGVTFYYTIIGVPLGLMGSLLLAMLLNQNLKGMRFCRTLFYLPTITPVVATSLLWKWIFNPTVGLLNFFLSKVGIEGPQWLASTRWAMPALILMSLWGIGGSRMIIFLAGLQGIPTQLYEAVEIDGAGSWQKFWNVTLPMITPTLYFNLVLGVITSFQVFTTSYVMTGGGPANATLFYVLYLYRTAFEWYRMGRASALAWVLFAVIIVFTMLIVRSSAAWVYYEGELRRRER